MLKPTHRKALLEILTSDSYESPDEMVKALVDTLDELRSEDTTQVIVRQYDVEAGSVYFGYGPYATRNQAEKAIERGRAGIPGEGKLAIVPLIHPTRKARTLEEVDEFEATHPGHWKRVREAVGI